MFVASIGHAAGKIVKVPWIHRSCIDRNAELPVTPMKLGNHNHNHIMSCHRTTVSLSCPVLSCLVKRTFAWCVFIPWPGFDARRRKGSRPETVVTFPPNTHPPRYQRARGHVSSVWVDKS